MKSQTSLRDLYEQERVLTLYRSMGQPEFVVCFGTASFDALPLSEMLENESQVFLLDCALPSIDASIAEALVSSTPDVSCVLSQLPPEEGQSWCLSRSAAPDGSRSACARFAVVEGLPPRCLGYERAAQPMLVNADTSAGRGPCFSVRCEELVAHAQTPLHAFELALEEVEQCALRIPVPTPLTSDASRLIISKDYVSGFETHPLSQLTDLVKNRFPDTHRDQRTLAAEHKLRRALMRTQLVAHLAELYRIVDKNSGRIYVTSTALRRRTRGGAFAISLVLSAFLDVASAYFDVDCELLPLTNTIIAVGDDERTAYFVLAPRPREDVLFMP